MKHNLRMIDIRNDDGDNGDKGGSRMEKDGDGMEDGDGFLP